jgi:dienelactone hydrolase
MMCRELISPFKSIAWFAGFALAWAIPVQAADEDLATVLKNLDSGVIARGKLRVPPLAPMLARDVVARLREANQADTRAWERIKNLTDWEQLRGTRLQALLSSLGSWPSVPKDLKIRVTGSHDGDGFRMENLVFQSRPGLVVTANLYRPAKPAASMPAILVSHSHAQPKHTTARQDMGMTWARAGCLVLVPDHLGHGERRQHPFGMEASHDYHARYDAGIQLHLAGESLMGWLVWDLMRGVDVLLAQKGVDPKRVVLISEPAGGGDVAAVTAALDPRISCVLVNNFGGPEPETPYPLPRDVERSFDYTTSGSWESTRNLRLSVRDGFLPWVIVAGVAPRRLVYYHEFYWDQNQDPVWKRLQRIYGFYNASDSLAGLAGQGFVVGSAPESTHWLAINRQIIYPVLERWFAIPNQKREYSNRRPLEDLLCLTPEAAKEFRPQPLYVLARELATARLAKARTELTNLSADERRVRLRKNWGQLLGDITPQADPVVNGLPDEKQHLGTVTVERIHLQTEPGIVVPVVLLIPSLKAGKLPVVVCLAQEGKEEFLKQRAGQVAELLSSGVVVCLPDVRGTGETNPGGGRDRRSPATSLSSSEWMLGHSLLGGRLRDLRSVLRHLRQQPRLDMQRLALWGDSFASVNPPSRDLKIPHSASTRPPQSEPLGGLLALLGGLFEDDVKAIYVHGGLSDFPSVFDNPLTYIPHDVVVPGILTCGDLCDLAATLAPKPLWLDRLVDGLNRAVPKEILANRYQLAISVYNVARASDSFRLGEQAETSASPARWLAMRLRR